MAQSNTGPARADAPVVSVPGTKPIKAEQAIQIAAQAQSIASSQDVPQVPSLAIHGDNNRIEIGTTGETTCTINDHTLHLDGASAFGELNVVDGAISLQAGNRRIRVSSSTIEWADQQRAKLPQNWRDMRLGLTHDGVRVDVDGKNLTYPDDAMDPLTRAGYQILRVIAVH